MKTNFLRITTKDKLILSGNLYSPDKATKKAVLHIHGMGGNFYENSFLEYMTKGFTAKGYSFLALNNRGAGLFFDFPIAGRKEKYKRIGNAYEKFEECIYDIKAGIDFLADQGYKDIILQGHSLGSVKSVYYLGKTKDSRISKLVLLSPPDMVGLAEDKDHAGRLALSTKLIKEGKGQELLPGLLWNYYMLSADTYINFSQRKGAIDVFNTYDKKASSIIAKITIPTFAAFGGTDDAAIMPLPEALAVIKSKAKNAPRFDTAIIEKAPHSYFGSEKKLVDTVIDWLN